MLYGFFQMCRRIAKFILLWPGNRQAEGATTVNRGCFRRAWIVAHLVPEPSLSSTNKDIPLAKSNFSYEKRQKEIAKKKKKEEKLQRKLEKKGSPDEDENGIEQDQSEATPDDES